VTSKVYFTTREIADLLGWQQQRARRWLKRADALVKRNGELVTTRELLCAAFPEAWQRIAEDAADREYECD
jgi:hypothetical protein